MLPSSLSERGAEFIARFEGFVATPYNDAAGNATIGYGHLLHMGPVTWRDRLRWPKISKARALKLLRKDAQLAATAVASVEPPIRLQFRFDALVSFVFNVGTGAFLSSTLFKKLKTDRDAAAEEFLKWDRAGGRVFAGLERRRQAERTLFLTGRYV